MKFSQGFQPSFSTSQLVGTNVEFFVLVMPKLACDLFKFCSDSGILSPVTTVVIFRPLFFILYCASSHLCSPSFLRCDVQFESYRENILYAPLVSFRFISHDARKICFLLYFLKITPLCVNDKLNRTTEKEKETITTTKMMRKMQKKKTKTNPPRRHHYVFAMTSAAYKMQFYMTPQIIHTNCKS